MVKGHVTNCGVLIRCCCQVIFFVCLFVFVASVEWWSVLKTQPVDDPLPFIVIHFKSYTILTLRISAHTMSAIASFKDLVKVALENSTNQTAGVLVDGQLWDMITIAHE